MGRDPAGYGASKLNLYELVASSPTSYIDPLGLWRIERRGQSRASAVANAGDTIENLAIQIGLNTNEYARWLKVDGWGELPADPYSPITCDHNLRYTIPNTVKVYFAKEKGFVRSPAVKELRLLSNGMSRGEFAAGFKVESVEDRNDQIFKDLWKDPNIARIRFVGHGAGPRSLSWNTPKTGVIADMWSGTAVAPHDVSPPYKLSAVHILACYSADSVDNPGAAPGQPRESFWRHHVSDNGVFIGAEGEYYVLGSDLKMQDNTGALKPEGTNE